MGMDLAEQTAMTRLRILCALGSLLAAACGSSDGENASGHTTTTAPPQDDAPFAPRGAETKRRAVVPVDEADPPEPSGYDAGTELVTTDNLNLRDGPGTSYTVLTVIPAGSRVEVVEKSGGDGWVHVGYADLVGWASADYLELAPELPDYDPVRGAKLASTAIAMWDGASAGNYCLKGVRLSAQASGIIPDPPGWTPILPSAIDWGNWANAHPAELAARGFRREELGVNEVPQGAIIVWQPGQCGYSSQYGHIEIVVDLASSKACSDFCGNVKKSCGDPWVFIPTTL
jgi:hypothetical protein